MPGLKDKYAILGIGETEYSRNSGRTTRSEPEANVAIGLQVKVDFAGLGDGLGLPRFRLADDQPANTSRCTG